MQRNPPVSVPESRVHYEIAVRERRRARRRGGGLINESLRGEESRESRGDHPNTRATQASLVPSAVPDPVTATSLEARRRATSHMGIWELELDPRSRPGSYKGRGRFGHGPRPVPGNQRARPEPRTDNCGSGCCCWCYHTTPPHPYRNADAHKHAAVLFP